MLCWSNNSIEGDIPVACGLIDFLLFFGQAELILHLLVGKEALVSGFLYFFSWIGVCFLTNLGNIFCKGAFLTLFHLVLLS